MVDITAHQMDRCVAIIKTALPRIDQDVLKKVMGSLEVELKYSDKVFADALQDSVTHVTQAYQSRIAHQKYQKFLNLTQIKKVKEFIEHSFPNDPFRGLSARLIGSSHGKQGSRLSAETIQHELLESYHSKLVIDLKLAGVFDDAMNASTEFDKQIADELQRLDNPDVLPDTENFKAKTIATIIRQSTDKSITDANKAGAGIGRLSMYIAKQVHNPNKIKSLGLKKYKELITPLLDWEQVERSAGHVINDQSKWLDGVYKSLSSGIHKKAEFEVPSFSMQNSVSKPLSASRTLHFLPGRWHEYNTQVGETNVFNAALSSLEKTARVTGLMKAFGPSALHNIDIIHKSIETHPKYKYERRSMQLPIEDIKKGLTGELGIPANEMIAAVGQGIRTFENLKLGGAAITALFGDALTLASEVKYQGGSLLKGYGVAFSSLFSGVSKHEKLIQARALGLMAQGWINHFTNRIDAEGNMSHTMSSINGTWFKINFLTPLTDRRRIATGIYLSSIAASRSSLKYDELSSAYKNTLRLFDIEDADWELLRQHGVETTGDTSLITLEKIAGISDESIVSAYKGTNRLKSGKDGTTSAFQIKEAREELSSKFHAYLIDRTSTAVLMPDIYSAIAQSGGRQAGTILGEVVRTALQFKGFPLLFVHKVLGRELYGRMDASRASIVMNIASLMVQGTLMGYLVVYTKAFLSNRKPPPLDDPDVLMRAFLVGGAGGIMADILFTELRKTHGSSFLMRLAGPGMTTGDTILDLIGRAKDGDLKAAHTIKSLYRESGIGSLFLTRAVIEYAFLYQLIEHFEPGYINKHARKLEQHGSGFIYKP